MLSPLTRLSMVLLAASLAACAAVAPPSQLPELLARHAIPVPAAQPPAAGHLWWQALHDDSLNRLMDQALARNADLRMALATVREARAMAGEARADGRPQGSLAAQAQVSRPSLPEVDPFRQGLSRPPEQRLLNLSQALSWELDLFGRLGTAQAVADRQVDMAEADARGAQALLQVEVVRHYTALRQAQQAFAFGAHQLALAEQQAGQVALRVRAGLADPRERDAAAAELAELRSSQAAFQSRQQVERASLAVLVGRSPAAPGDELQQLLRPALLPALPEESLLTVPPDLLQRRPDVARADAQLRAQLGQQVLAQRAYLPRLSLAASFGLNERAGHLGDRGALRYAAGPVLQWDWLDGGRLAAQEAAARAGSEREWARLEQTVLSALAEGEASLQGWQAAYQAWRQAMAAAQAAENQARYTEQRAALGLEAQTQALGARRRQWAAEQQVVVQQAQALSAYAQVQLALGAWQP